MSVHDAIARADAILPGTPVSEGELDPRWQAIIAVGEYVESHPEAVWAFTRRWGGAADPDLRAAVATCLLEHLLEYHFALLFPRVAHEARADLRFAETLSLCWQLGQAREEENAARLRALQGELRADAG